MPAMWNAGLSRISLLMVLIFRYAAMDWPDLEFRSEEEVEERVEQRCWSQKTESADDRTETCTNRRLFSF